MSHGTKIGQRAPSSKIGRNSRKCERYTLNRTQDRNKMRGADSRERRWERDNQQRIHRLGILLTVMQAEGVSTHSIAYQDQETKLVHACGMRGKRVA